MADDARRRFFQDVQTTVDYCHRVGQQCDNNTRETLVQRLQNLRRDIGLGREEFLTEEQFQNLVSAIKDMEQELLSHQDESDNAYRTERAAGERGAPKFLISSNQLEFLKYHGFTAKKMSGVLQTSEATVRRRLKDNNLKLREGKFSNISDEDLDQMIKEIIGTNRQLGPNAVLPRLKEKGVIVQRERVRQSCRRVDSVGVAMRSLGRRNIVRRRYKSLGPNEVWHIDGYHKLVRWGIFIHGAIDGFSRLVTFLHASNNNRSSTVLDLFLHAAAAKGTPSRIRVDHGVENVEICRYMEEKRGRDRGSALRGKSCHNQRIERLWVDVWEGVANEYHDLFIFLEEELQLDITDLRLMEVFHAVFLPRLNVSLDTFVYQYNNHKLSTEHYRTPNEIFITGVLQNINSTRTSIQDLVHDPSSVEANQAIDTAAQGEENHPSDQIPNDTDILVARIQAQINVLEKASDVSFGATLFSRAKQLAQTIADRDFHDQTIT